MNPLPSTPTRRALVASDSPIARDPRVLRQINWLMQLGWRVDTVGRGPQPSDLNGSHESIPRRSIVARTAAYLFLPNRLKYRVLMSSMIPEPLQHGHVAERYDLVLLNEIEMLPWFADVRQQLLDPHGASHLDLHEYAPSQRAGLAYRLVFKRFRDWMTAFIPSESIDSRSTVGDGIAGLYVSRFGIKRPSIVRSCPNFVDQRPSTVDPDNIRLIHHGVASNTRSLDRLITAMATAEKRFSLELMLVGSAEALAPLKKLAEPFGDRVRFRDPVKVHEIPTAINASDIELIFFPPINDNLRFALPNKFFEAVQGRLAVVTGESQEMVNVINEYGNGAIVSGWTPEDLGRRLNQLTAVDIAEMKNAAHEAAHQLSAESERERFIDAVFGEERRD